MNTPGERFPLLVQVVLDTTDARRLAEFYRRLLGYRYRPGDEPPSAGRRTPRRDWLVLRDAADANKLAFQQVKELPEPTWPEGPRPPCSHRPTIDHKGQLPIGVTADEVAKPI